MEILADPITINCRKVLAGLKMLGTDYTLTKKRFMVRLIPMWTVMMTG